MEKERQIRFLYPPLMLFGSLLLGLFFNENNSLEGLICSIEIFKTQELILAILGGGAITLLLGYVIGTITILFLRLIFINNGGAYEVNDKQDFEDIGESILEYPKDKIKRKERLYAFVTYDHHFLPKDIHEWVQKRWSTFHTASNITTSLILSIAIGISLGIQICASWIVIVLVLAGIFIFHAHRARNETINMVMFQTKIKRSQAKQ
jgi:hypothetical protein